MTTKKKIGSFREDFARFLENPSRDALRETLKNHLGEFPDLDFKSQWQSDASLAKDMLAMANSGGGCFVFGVSETEKKTLDPTGLEKLRDKADVDNATRRFLPQTLMDNWDVLDFSYESSEYAKLVGKVFQVLIVRDSPQDLPFMATRETEGIRSSEIYVRRTASSHAAGYEEIQSIINRRIATGHSTQHTLDLSSHLDDLRRLYGQLELFYRQHYTGSIASRAFLSSGFAHVGGEIVQKETFEDFINRMIVLKKRKVERLLCG